MAELIISKTANDWFMNNLRESKFFERENEYRNSNSEIIGSNLDIWIDAIKEASAP